ncbi:MAG: cysteine desulfurase [Alphaproteobacteria bacterium]|nr:cysteine desulfurase [Alphaproteobacteria bacterium]
MKAYFDYNATVPLRDSVRRSMTGAMDLVGNASSVHSFGREVRKKIESSRQRIAMALDLEAKRVIFTSGATESNNLALKNFRGRVIASLIEHDSVLKVRDDIIAVPVSADGIIDLECLERLLSEDANKQTLVSVMAANNETGVIQPLAEVIQLAKKYGAYVHSDAVQAIGKMNFPWHTLDMISISGHKLGGPAGIGCLVINPSLPLIPHTKGGGQERSYRAGTENLIGIVGMADAVEESLKDDWTQTEKLRNILEGLISEIDPNALIIKKETNRLSNTVVLYMAGVKSETQIMSFDLKGFAVSAGSACSSGKVKTSRVLEAMGFNTEKSGQTIRVSMGVSSNFEEINEFVKVWQSIYEKCSNTKNKYLNKNRGDNHEFAYGA